MRDVLSSRVISPPLFSPCVLSSPPVVLRHEVRKCTPTHLQPTAFRAGNSRSLHTSSRSYSNLTPEDEAKIQGFKQSLSGKGGQGLKDILRDDRIDWRAKEKAIQKRLEEFEQLQSREKLAQGESRTGPAGEIHDEATVGRTDDAASKGREQQKESFQSSNESQQEQSRNRRLAEEHGNPFGGPAEPQMVAWQQFLVFLLAGLIFVSMPEQGPDQEEIGWNDCRSLLRAGKVDVLTIVNGESVRVSEKTNPSHTPPPREPRRRAQWFKIRSAGEFQSDLEQVMAEMDIPWDQRPAVEVVDEQESEKEKPGLLYYLLPLAVALPILLL